MQRNIQILDCTLRDGGRIINCAFDNQVIGLIAEKLTRANIDRIELGFLRDKETVHYTKDSTFFTDVDQMKPFIPGDRGSSSYTAFIDFGMFDFETLKDFDGTSIDGIRLGFTKSDYKNHFKDLITAFQTVKTKGYQLYIQGVNSLNYCDRELLEIIEMVNSVEPMSFGIVDTYGAMYVDDVARLYGLIDHNLDREIAIDFHSHNNFQLSFSFAQEIIRLSNGVRPIIIDATLWGMGKGAGNLNTELIADFLVRKKAYNYETDILFDAIDEHLYDWWQEYHWGYSPASLMSGIYRSHPNNVIYLTQKFRLDTKDIKNILAMMDENERQRYNYDKLDLLIENYKATKYDDTQEIKTLSRLFDGRTVLILAPGITLKTHADAITEYRKHCNPVVISVNFLSDFPDAYGFYAHRKRYNRLTGESHIIVTSDIARRAPNEIVVSYHKLIAHGNKMFDNSTIMLLNLLKRLKIKKIAIAGMDGYSSVGSNNYFDPSLKVRRLTDLSEQSNMEIAKSLEKYLATVKGICDVSLITPSRFEKVFENDKNTGNGCRRHPDRWQNLYG